MNLRRRHILQLAGGALTLPAVSRFAFGQSYPSKSVRIIVGFGAGGAPDILPRLVGQWLTDRLGQTFVVENRPGASGNLATEAVVAAPPDGYTLLSTSLSNAVNASLYTKLKFDFTRDIAAVAGISRDPDVVVVNPAFPAKTLAEFIAYAKANPGKINMASPGVGTSPHMAGELFNYMAGIKMTHVAYRASPPAIADLLAGQVQVYFSPISAGVSYIKSGRLRPLAVTTATRSDAFPDVPPIAAFVPGYDVSAWYGIGAPRGTPADIIDTLNKTINAGLADPKMREKFAALGSQPYIATPAEFGKFTDAEAEKWAKVVKFAGIRAD
jgi:tripartite-type tricarboxylate transporter receptor subunit TctC